MMMVKKMIDLLIFFITAADPLYSLGVGLAHTHVQPVTRFFDFLYSDNGINHFIISSKVPCTCVDIDYAPTLRFHLCKYFVNHICTGIHYAMKMKWKEDYS